MALLHIGRPSDFDDRLRRLTVLGRHVGIYRDGDGELRGIEVSCRHQNADLTLGERRGDLVICPRHGWVYDLGTGACLDAPWARLRRFAVTVDGDRVLFDPTPLPTEDEP